MKIVHVIWTKFPVEGYGGTERVAYWLAKAQAEMGHEVSVLCRPGSHLPFAKILELPESIADLDPFIPAGTEIVQLYGTPNFKLSYPYLVNIGGNGQAGEKYSPNTVFVSRNHAQRHNWSEFVYNGIDLSEYPLGPRARENFLLFLAKASWRVKNLVGAIKIAQDSGRRLKVCGGRAPFWMRGVDSMGTLGGDQKLSLLQSARALLFPVIWNEPFGLAVVEALACGTPVIATSFGSLREIIDPSCGRLCESHEEFVEAIENISLAPEACRLAVEKKFSHTKMAEAYLEKYKIVLGKGKLRDGFPYAAPDANPQQKIYYQNYKRAWY